MFWRRGTKLLPPVIELSFLDLPVSRLVTVEAETFCPDLRDLFKSVYLRSVFLSVSNHGKLDRTHPGVFVDKEDTKKNMYLISTPTNAHT